jgi:hypothetical protein
MSRLATIISLLRLWMLLVASALATSVGFGYDSHDKATIAYDNGGKAVIGYDAVVELTADATRNGMAGDRALFAKIAEFLAAKTPLALPAPRQIVAEWGVNTYRHGGQMSAVEHINYRHAFNSGFKDVSRYAEGTSVHQIQGYVDDALRYGKVTPNGANGFQIEHSLGRVIGTDQVGNAASGIRVFVRDGNIQTAFPIP